MKVQSLMLLIPCGQFPRVLARVTKGEGPAVRRDWASLVGCRSKSLELRALIYIQGDSHNLSTSNNFYSMCSTKKCFIQKSRGIEGNT